jgi:hypothetical protein
MAISNRDRIDRGLQFVVIGLSPFVEHAMSEVAPGGDWIALIKSRDEAKHGSAKNLDRNDPALLLRVVTEETQVFKKYLSRPESAFASELREIRNKWAHAEAFSSDDTYRALDTMERLLTVVGAPLQADEVRKIRLDLQRTSIEAETRKTIKSQTDSGISIAVAGLKPWREVLQPHKDVATGNYSASEFAADLQGVSQGEGSAEYVEPIEFFRRTYLTSGLRDLLDKGIDRICGDPGANPIINLQTNFGGGKTHSMLALWHIFSGTAISKLPQDVQELVGSRKIPNNVNRVALVGTHLSAVASTKSDGTVVKTIWGELAYQLGGKKAYDIVKEADQKSVSPGKEFKALLEMYSPSVILIDEWVAYARQLWGREDLDAGTFDTQFSFAQTLTEVAKTVPGTFLVISIPASHDPQRDGESQGSALEVGGPNGQEALRRLQNVVRRVADPWSPASPEESFEIVRRRLFEEPTAQALNDIAITAKKFVEFYRNHVGEFPAEASDLSYENRIKAAFPIHPELFDRLYKDWSTLERFQRTRGVLRLMSTVVHALWVNQDASPMILPSNIPLHDAKVSSELTQYLPDQWKAIIDTDIAGGTSTPAGIDKERPLLGQRAITQRIATTIFMGATPTLTSAHKGIERHNVWLGSAVPGDTVGNFGSAIDLLQQRASYFYGEGSRYWFDTQPGIGRKVADYAESLRDRPEDVWLEIIDRLRNSESKSKGSFAAVQIAPVTSADIPDTEDARLVILGPSVSHAKSNLDSDAMKFAMDASERRGTSMRTNRNMLVFLAPDSKRLEELMDATRQLLGWRWMSGRYEEENLTPNSQRQVETNLKRSDEDVTRRILDTYHWAISPTQPDPQSPATMSVEKSDGSQERLADRVSDRLARAGMLVTQIGSRNIRMELESKLDSAWQQGHISLGDLWSFYCRYPYLTRLRDRRVLDDAVRSVLTSLASETEGFSLAEQYDEKSNQYLGLVVPSGSAQFGQLMDTTLLVDTSIAQAQFDRALAGRPGDLIETSEIEKPEETSSEPSSEKPSVKSRYFGVASLDPERNARDFGRISTEVLAQFLAIEGIQVEVTVEIRATTKDGFSDDKIRIVSENARTLKFKQSGFEQA